MSDLNKIKETLKANNKTQNWLSDYIGVSRNSISKWCNNEIQPNLSDLDKIAEALNIDILSLITSKQPDVKKFFEYRLKFLKPYYLPSMFDGILIYYPYTINDKLLYGIQMGISGSLSIGWGFQIWQHENADETNKLLIKALFQEATKQLKSKILTRTLKQVEKFTLLTSNSPNRMPYNPEELDDPEGQSFSVKIDRSHINLVPYIDVHCKFYMTSGEMISGVLLLDNLENYFIVKSPYLREFQQLKREEDAVRKNELKFYVDAFDILNIELINPD